MEPNSLTNDPSGPQRDTRHIDWGVQLDVAGAQKPLDAPLEAGLQPPAAEPRSRPNPDELRKLALRPFYEPARWRPPPLAYQLEFFWADSGENNKR